MKIIADLKKALPYQGGDELSSDMSSSLEETPRYKRGEDVIKKTTAAVMLVVSLLVFLSGSVSAQSTPSFPACLNPTGTLTVNYDSGIHGIIGDSAIYSGSDRVYRLSEETLLQCFCSTDGSGIQTDWWKISSLSQSEVNALESQGWKYVPTGLVWGLDNSPYMAKNSTYSCPPSTVTVSTTSVSSGESTVGSGQVLGVAAAGTLRWVLGAGLLGLVFVFAGRLFLKRNGKDNR